MKQDVIENILFTVKQKLVDLQDDLSKRLSRYEFDHVMPKLLDLEAACAAMKIAIERMPLENHQVSLQQLVSELLDFNTIEDGQTITVINQSFPGMISGPINHIVMLVQTLSKVFASVFDPDSIVRSIEFGESTVSFKFLLLKHEYSNDIICTLNQLLQISTPESIYEQELAAFETYSSQLYQIFALQKYLDATISINEQSRWFELQLTVPEIVADGEISCDAEKIYVFVDGEHNDRYLDMIQSVANFELCAMQTLHDIDYLFSLAAKGECPSTIVLIESNDTLMEFVRIFQKYDRVLLPKSMLVSYIGSNYLQVPLPTGLRFYNDRLISTISQSELQPVLSIKKLTVKSAFSRRIRIFLLEDHVASSSYLGCLLADSCDIIHMSDPIKALAYVQEDSDFDILLIDIGLPSISGIEFVQMLPESAQRIPKIAVTAHLQSQLELKQQGFDQLLAKPYRSQQLFQIIQHYCGV